MKERYTIELDYQNALNRAAELEGLASQLRSIANDEFAQALENVKNAWQGDNAQKYVQKARKMKPKMIKASDDLKEVASTIRTVAKNTYDAEMKAYEIANERSY